MTIEQAIKNKLLARTQIVAIVNNRIYYPNLPQNPTYPAIIFFLLTGLRYHDIDVAYPYYQFDSWAPTYMQSIQLANEIRLTLQREKGIWDGISVIQGVFKNETDVEEPNNPNLFHRASDFEIIYRGV